MQAGTRSTASAGPPGHRDSAGRGICRDPERDDHASVALPRLMVDLGISARTGAMADDRVHC